MRDLLLMALPVNKNANEVTPFALSSFMKPLAQHFELGFTHTPITVNPAMLYNTHRSYRDIAKLRATQVARQALNRYFTPEELSSLRTLGKGFFGTVFSMQSSSLLRALSRINADIGRNRNLRNVVMNTDLLKTGDAYINKLKQRLGGMFAVKVECLTSALEEMRLRRSKMDKMSMHVKSVSESINHLTYNMAILNYSEKIKLRPEYEGGPKEYTTARFRGYDFSPIFCAAFTVDDTGPTNTPATYRITLMEFINGEPMGNVIARLHKQRQPLDMRYYVQLEYAVATMWQAGIIHTDMHLSNIMLSNSDGLIKIIDFGMAVNLPMLHEEAQARNDYEWADITSKVMDETANAIENFSASSGARYLSRVYKPPITISAGAVGQQKGDRAPNYFEVARVLMVFRKLGKFNPESLALDMVRAAAGYPELRDIQRGPKELADKWAAYLKSYRIQLVLRTIPSSIRSRAYANSSRLKSRPPPMGSSQAAQARYNLPIHHDRNRFLRRMARWMRIKI